MCLPLLQVCSRTHFLATFLVGKEQMHCEGVIFCLHAWVIFLNYLHMHETVAKF